MCTYICSVIIQVIVTVMKKTAFEKRYKGGKGEKVTFTSKEERASLLYLKLRELIAMNS